MLKNASNRCDPVLRQVETTHKAPFFPFIKSRMSPFFTSACVLIPTG